MSFDEFTIGLPHRNKKWVFFQGKGVAQCTLHPIRDASTLTEIDIIIDKVFFLSNKV